MAYTTINKSTDYFNTKLISGNGSTQNITGVGFQPDFTWIKQRGGTTDHHLYDALRGTTKALASNNGDAETTKATGLTAFGSDGFTLGSDGGVNGSSNTYVGWSWKAGTTGSGTTSGSGTGKAYSYSVNTTAGFSIVKYLGNGSGGHTIPHHLGAVPKMILVKRIDAVNNWTAYNVGIGNGYGLYLDNEYNKVDSNAFWNDTTPTSTVFTLGDGASVNNSSGTYIAYCWTDKTGYSKFGSYEGNGNANGAFVYTGFKPTFVIIKNADGNENWHIFDSKRGGPVAGVFGNPNKYFLQPNTTNTEANETLDFYSNGFKPRITNAFLNGNTLIYMAFGQSLVGSNNVPCTAR